VDDSEQRALLLALQAQIAELTAAIRPAPVAVTFAELYEKYEAAQRKRTSWETISYALKRAKAAWGARRAMDLRPSDWTELRAANASLSDATLNLDLSCVLALLNWAARERLIPSNPLQGARKVKLARRHRETAPVEDDVQALLAEARQIERVLILCWADAGMRNGESRQLQWPWIDRERMEIRLPNDVCKNKRGGVVPMTQRLLEAIDAMPRRLGSPYVLPNEEGVPYSRVTVCRWMRDLVKRAGVQAAPGDESVKPHDLRHGYGTNAAERGVRIEVIQQVLRHASLDQTRDYVQRRPNDLDGARRAFEAGIERDRSRR